MHLERLIHILEVTALSGDAVSVSEICAATGYPKPSCYRLVQDLVATGLLESPEKGLFRIGSRLHRISTIDRSDTDVAAIAEPLLQELADQFGVACFLSRLRGDGVEITHVVFPKDKGASFLHPGLGFRPLHACSCAKVIAAYSSPEVHKDLFDGPLRQYTDFTQTDPSKLKTEFEDIRAQGFGECVQELELGICSVAAPVSLGELGVGLSIGATGTVRVFTKDFRDRIGAALIETANDLGDRLNDAVGIHP